MPCCRIFVGGLEGNASSEAVRAHFSRYGTVLDVVLPCQRQSPKISSRQLTDGQSLPQPQHRGFCFVTFSDGAAASRALAAGGSGSYSGSVSGGGAQVASGGHGETLTGDYEKHEEGDAEEQMKQERKQEQGYLRFAEVKSASPPKTSKRHLKRQSPKNHKRQLAFGQLCDDDARAIVHGTEGRAIENEAVGNVDCELCPDGGTCNGDDDDAAVAAWLFQCYSADDGVARALERKIRDEGGELSKEALALARQQSWRAFTEEESGEIATQYALSFCFC